MKNFIKHGVRIRKNTEKNYYSVWMNLETIRLDLGSEKALEPERSEFYDVGITERCNAMCPFCYVSADKSRKDYTGIVETWKRWMDTFPKDTPIDILHDKTFREELLKPTTGEGPQELEIRLKLLFYIKKKLPIVYTEKPTQIAIGSVGEPTIHPDLPKFLQAVYESDVVPNYTTNGILLSGDKGDEVMEATRNFCGGVAVSYGNKSLRDQADKAIENLLKNGECKVIIHHIIEDKNSVDDLTGTVDKWGKDIHYHVLLPLMKHGRSDKEMNTETYLYLMEQLSEKDIKNVAFGANFAPFMKENSTGKIDVWEYPQEIYSKNILLKNGEVIITPSSFNLEAIKTIKLWQ